MINVEIMLENILRITVAAPSEACIGDCTRIFCSVVHITLRCRRWVVAIHGGLHVVVGRARRGP